MRALSASFSARFRAFACAFASFFRLAPFTVAATVLWIAAMSWASSRWAYQMSIVRICANSATASRYTVRMARGRRPFT